MAAAALGGVAVAAPFVMPDEREPPGPKAAQPAPRPATPYDFDDDGRQELVVAMLGGSARGNSARSGVVLVQRAPGDGSAWQVITQSRAGLAGRPSAGDDFGSGLASADFDRDGHADLAIGTPGRERVSIVYGAQAGLEPGRKTQQLSGSRAGLPDGAGNYGYVLVARDLDGDRYDDLVVGAPGALGGPSTGALHVVFGGASGLRSDRSRVIARPSDEMTGFGRRLRSGDVDGDGRPDLAEGSPSRGDLPGHLSYCRSGRYGPLRCSELGSESSTSSLAVGDVNGDDRADIVQGDAAHVDPAVAVPVSGGEVRVWTGTSRGPRSSPLMITQDSPEGPRPQRARGRVRRRRRRR